MEYKGEQQLEEYLGRITHSDQISMKNALQHWMSIAKPLNSLGRLEEVVTKIAGIVGTSNVSVKKKGLIIMCADNGVVEEGISQTGQEVTAIVSENFAKHDTSVCVMAEYAGVEIFPIDIGIVTEVQGIEQRKVMNGTNNMLHGPAMSREQAIEAIKIGIEKVQELKQAGYEILATGEMGIGNTTTSSAVASILLDTPVETVTGRGAGLTSEGIEHKIQVIKESISLNQPNGNDPIDVLAKVGGLDIAGLVGVFLGGAIYHIPIVIDGFISGVSALIASRLHPICKEYAIASHVSKEPAGMMLLDALELKPFLTCDMCLGEGTGAVAAMPIIDMAVAVYHQMRTFQEIKVEQYVPLK